MVLPSHGKMAPPWTVAMCTYSHIKLFISPQGLASLVAEDKMYLGVTGRIFFRLFSSAMQVTQGPGILCLADFKLLPGFRALGSKGDETLFLYLAWNLETDISEVSTVESQAGLSILPGL